MKKSILLFPVFILISIFSSAQVFVDSLSNRLRYDKIAANESVYYKIENHNLIIYETNLSIKQTITLPTRQNSIPSNVFYFSRTLFDNDNGFEFIINYTDTNTNLTSDFVWWDNNQTNSFPNLIISGFLQPLIFNIGNSSQLVIFRYDQNISNTDHVITYVYDLPGSVLSVREIPLDDQTSIHPNPTQDIINISGHMGESVWIYDASGRLVHESLLEGKTTIDVSNFNSGFYNVRTIGGKNYKFLKQ